MNIQRLCTRGQHLLKIKPSQQTLHHWNLLCFSSRFQTDSDSDFQTDATDFDSDTEGGLGRRRRKFEERDPERDIYEKYGYGEYENPDNLTEPDAYTSSVDPRRRSHFVQKRPKRAAQTEDPTSVTIEEIEQYRGWNDVLYRLALLSYHQDLMRDFFKNSTIVTNVIVGLPVFLVLYQNGGLIYPELVFGYLTTRVLNRSLWVHQTFTCGLARQLREWYPLLQSHCQFSVNLPANISDFNAYLQYCRSTEADAKRETMQTVSIFSGFWTKKSAQPDAFLGYRPHYVSSSGTETDYNTDDPLLADDEKQERRIKRRLKQERKAYRSWEYMINRGDAQYRFAFDIAFNFYWLIATPTFSLGYHGILMALPSVVSDYVYSQTLFEFAVPFVWSTLAVRAAVPFVCRFLTLGATEEQRANMRKI